MHPRFTRVLEQSYSNGKGSALRLLLLFLLLLGSKGAAQSIAAWGDNSLGELQIPEGITNAIAVTGGIGQCLALRVDGTVVGWGRYQDGATNVLPPNLSGVRAIACGANHNLALKADGTVVAWGEDAYGQTNVPPGLSDAVAITAGVFFSVAVRSDGTVVVWGSGPYGETNVPAGLSNVVDVVSGAQHTLALLADGTVKSWGVNTYGQTNVPAGLSDVIAIAAGEDHSLAVNSNGSVVAWGNDTYGQCDVPLGLTDVVAIAAGSAHSLALRADGTVVAWGAGASSINYGQAAMPPGLSGVTAIGAGYDCSLAVAFDGPLKILQDPQSVSVLAGSNATLSVAVTGLLPVTYQWFKNNQPLLDSGGISGATNPVLSIGQAQFADGALYDVLVSNAVGSILSAPALLTVASPPVFTLQPSDTDNTTPAGTNIVLTAIAQGTTPLYYQWQFDDAPIANATNSVLSLTNIQAAQAGTYALLASNSVGSTLSHPLILSVTASLPYVVIHPSNQLAPVFGSTVFSVDVRGSQPFGYQWRFNGVAIPNATNASLLLGPLGPAQSGYYNVIVSNALGQASSAKAKLSVLQAILSTNIPSYLYTNQTTLLQFVNLVDVSGSATYDAVTGLRADGSLIESSSSGPPILNGVAALASPVAALQSDGVAVQWTPPYGGSPPKVTVLASNIAAMAGIEMPSLLLASNATVAWSDNPSLVAPGLSNIVGIAATYGQGLALRSDGTVAALQMAPPASGVTNAIAVSIGGGGDLALLSNGTVVGWGDFPAAPFPNATNIVAIAASQEYALALTDDGHVLAEGVSPPLFPFALSNVFRMAADFEGDLAIVLVGNGSPFVTVQPGSQFVNQGATVWLHARAVGLQPMNYQWQFDGVNIEGATNADLTITNLQNSAYGDYQALISNRVAWTATRAALVSVPTPFPPSPPTPSSYTLAEALQASNLVWSTSGNKPWFTETNVTHDAFAAAESGFIGNSQESVLQTEIHGPGILTFWWMVSSEEDFDFLEFWIDNTNVAAISGETAWQQQSFVIGANAYLLQWVYGKDPDVSSGQDAGWLDQVVFTPTQPVVLSNPQIKPDGTLSFSARTSGGAAVPLNNPNGLYFEASSNLIEWTPLTNSLVLTNGSVSVSDPDATNRTARFYRLTHP